MAEIKQGFRRKLEILWAIASKDIIDAFKNKISISLLLGGLLLALSNQALPLLVKIRKSDVVVIYDPGRSELTRSLRSQEGIIVSIARSPIDLSRTLLTSPRDSIGLIFPEDLDERISSGQKTTVTTYTAYWLNQDKLEKLMNSVQLAFDQSGDQFVQIDPIPKTVYFEGRLEGHIGMFVILLVNLILLVGIGLVPLLFSEEREKRTLSVLMVSPARFSQITAGKAFAGIFYCLIISIALLALNVSYIAHWPVTILTVLACSAFAVMTGLLIGALIENATNMSMLVGVFLLILLAPALAYFLAPNLSPGLSTLLGWFPSTLVIRLFEFSFREAAQTSQFLPLLAGLLGFTLLIYLLVVWKIRRIEHI